MQLLRNSFNRIERTKDGWIYFIFFIICIAVYFKSLTNGYSLDDDYLLNDASVRQGVGSAADIFSSRYITYYHTNYEYRPFAKLLFALEYQWFGLRPAPAHFVNILLYFFSAVLFFRLLLLLKFIPGKAFAFFSVLIFLVHPLHTEVVCSIKNADILLCSVFSFSAAITMLRFSSCRKIHLFVASLILLMAGLLSKLDALTFCGIIPALVFLNDRSAIKQSIFIFASFIILYLVFVKTRKFMLSGEEDKILRKMSFHENPLVDYKDLKHKLAAIPVSFGFYIEKIFFPFKMSAYYGYKTIDIHEPFSQRFFYTGFVSLSFIASAVWKYRKNNLLLFSLLMIAGPISMYLNFPKAAPGIVADRFSFTAITGFAILFTYLLFSLKSEKLKTAFSYAAVVFVVVFVTVSVKRSFDWKDHLTLIESDLKKYPSSAMLHFLKGSFLTERAKGSDKESKNLLDSSITSYRKSIELYEPNASAWNNLAGIYFFRFRDFKKAYPGFKRAYELFPHSDNKILYAKSAFLSNHLDEFYKIAVPELNSSGGNEMKTFIDEFPQFLNPDTIKRTFAELIERGVTNVEALLSFAAQMKQLNMKTEEKEFMFLAFKNGYRNKELAADLAEYYYENGNENKASFLMDIYEGKIK